METFKLFKSFVPIDKPRPNIGPINGDMSMAPITTAAELMFKPTEHMIMEQIKIHTLYPLNGISFNILSLTS